MPKVLIAIVASNSMKYLPAALASIEAQTFPDCSVIVVDNASADGVEKFLRERHPRVIFLRNTKNLGQAHAYNQAIAYGYAHLRKGDEEFFVLTMAPDVALSPGYVERLVKEMAQHPEAGSMVGTMYRARIDVDDGEEKTVPLETVDSTGLRVRPWRAVEERGVLPGDAAAAEGAVEIFGAPGALALYRASALDSIAYKDRYFDDELFAYKEDIDLAWRLRACNWSSFHVPGAIAYRHRGAPVVSRVPVVRTYIARNERATFVRQLSYRNHLLVLFKNERLANVLLYLPLIAVYEFGKLAYIVATEPATLASLPSFFRLLPAALQKRGDLSRHARATAGELRKWIA